MEASPQLTRGKRAGIGPALLLARRMAAQAPGRSALIALMVAIPILGLSALGTVATSSVATPSERIDYELGQMQAYVVMQQPPDPSAFQQPGEPYSVEYAINEMGGEPLHHAADAAVLPIEDVLPPGTRTIPILDMMATVRTAAGLGSMSAVVGDAWDPAFAGHFDLVEGSVPTSPDEIMVTPSALKRFGVSIGQDVEVTQPVAATFSVVGTLRSAMQPASTQTIFGNFGTPPGLSTNADDTYPAQYYLPDLELDWAAVQQLNKQGAGVLSRHVLENPVDPSTYTARNGPDYVGIVSAVAVFGVFALFEVGLLAGAAFMVGARQQQRALAILSSVGGDKRMLFRVVSFGGLVLGAVGGLAGIVLGVVASWVVMRITADGSSSQYPGFHPQLLILAAIFVFAVLVGWLSAMLPARAASRLDVAGALRGATRPPSPTRKKPIAGIVILVIGAVLAIVGGVITVAAIRAPAEFDPVTGDPLAGSSVVWGFGLALVALGPVLMQVGALFLTPLLLRLSARLLSAFGSGARLGSRDAARNSVRTVPAVAAIMSTVFVASALMTTISAYQLESDADYQYTTTQNTARAFLYGFDASGNPQIEDTGAAVTQALNTSFGIDSARVISSAPDYPQAANADQDEVAVPRYEFYGDSRYVGSSGTDIPPKITVGSAADFEAIMGEPLSEQSRQTLADGGVVSLYPEFITNGTVTLDWFSDTSPQYTDTGDGTPVRTASLNASLQSPTTAVSFGLLMTPDTAANIKLDYFPWLVIAPMATAPTTAQTDAARAAVEAITGRPDYSLVTVESGPDPYGQTAAWIILAISALIVLGAASVALGLARADGRRDDAVLGAIGAPPNLRRSIGFWQAIVIAGIGTIVGVVFGLVPPLALAIPPADGGAGLLPFNPPWMQLALAAVAVPLVIAVGSWLTASGAAMRRVNRSLW